MVPWPSVRSQQLKEIPWSKMTRQESDKNATPAVTAAVAQLEDDVLELLIQDELRGVQHGLRTR